MAFRKATKQKTFARVALLGPAGSGKSFTGLRLATTLAAGGKVAAFDTERGSLSKYVGDPNPDGGVFAFDVMDDMPDFDVRRYIEAIRDAEAAGYSALVIDSLSHAWSGPGGILEFVDSRKSGNNGFSAWRDATPLHNKLVDTMLSAKMHLIVTMRTKMDYVQEKDANGKTVIRKVGMQPVQRDGVEYEFDVVADLDNGNMTVSKTRCSTLRNKRFIEPGADVAGLLMEWLNAGEDAPPAAPTPRPHDPSWTASRAAFCAALGERGLQYDEVAAWCETKGWPRPSQMNKAKRDGLLKYLNEHPDDVAAITGATTSTPTGA